MLTWLKQRRWPWKKKEVKTEEGASGMLIWGVLEGPFYGSEVPNTNFEDDNVMMVLQVSSEDRVFPAEFWFNNMEEAREISDHFRKSITPLPMNMKEYELE